MDALASELSKPAAHIHRHNLIGNLDVVLKQTVASPDAESRLDVRLLKASGNQSGWEIFSLDYRAESPLNTLLSPNAMASYTKAFRFIWRLKRCEHLLAASWKALSLSSRAKNPITDKNPSLFLLSHLFLTDMIQFIDKFLYYLTMVVIEGAYHDLDKALKEAKDLDIYLKCHNAFLETILVNGIFSRPASDDTTSRALQQKLFQILQIILGFAKQQVLNFP
jgi:gamma-tubulin complex component 3